MLRKHSLPTVALAVAVGIATGCGESLAPGAAVAAVLVAPSDYTMHIDDSIQLSAAAIDATGTPVSTTRMDWSSDNSAVAQVSPNGVVTGLSAGSAVITANAEGESGAAHITVSAVTAPQPCTDVSSVVISPAAVTLTALDATIQLSASALNSAGTLITGVGMSWSSLNTSIATVGTMGLVTATNVGTALIVAAATGCSPADTLGVVVEQEVSAVTVTPPTASVATGGVVTLQARAEDANGNPISSQSISWSSSAPAVATVSGSGQVTGISAGTAYIRAAADTKSDTAAIAVTGTTTPPPPPSSGNAIFVDDFDAGTTSGALNGVSWKSSGVNTSVTSDNPYSGTHSMKFSYPGKPDECADATAERRFNLPQLTEVWLEYMFYLPANFAHRQPAGCSSNAANQKLLRVWGPTENAYGSNNPKGGASYDPAAGGPNSFVYLQWGDYNNTILGPQDAASRWHDSFNDAQRGQWMQLRWHLKLASADGAADGEMQLWVNGELKVNLTGKDWHTEAGVNNWFSTGYLMGWVNSSYAQDTDFFVDDFRVFSSNPGW